jgi:hypothetical protein
MYNTGILKISEPLDKPLIEINMHNVKYNGCDPAVIDRAFDLIGSGIGENINLGMTLLEREAPLFHATLLGYTSKENITKEMLVTLSRKAYIMPGDIVRYRGMDSSPTMVVSEMKAVSNGGIAGGYHVKLLCKYYNKSSQKFEAIEDRIECFDRIKLKYYNDEYRNTDGK